VSYRLILKPSAEKQLDALPRQLQQRIVRKLAELQENPRMPGATKLAGLDATYRVRVGDYRIVYVIDDPRAVVFVTIIGNRGDVYRRM
jgi:mRNA interferase RelE/StbE